MNQQLIEAAKVGDAIEVERLLKAGAINGPMESTNLYTEGEGDLALCWAALNGHLAVVQLLLEKGPNVHANLALHGAAENGHLEVVQLLLDRGSNVHVRDDVALRVAARNGHVAVVQLLLDHGANLHAEDDQALGWAAGKGHLAVVQLLLEAGAIPSQDMIEATPNLEIKELLQAKLDELEWQALGPKSATKC